MSEPLPAADQGSSYERDQVIKIINSVIAKVEHTEDESTGAIFKELQNLQKIIEEARSEIGSTRPSDIKDKYIPTATDELDAIVEATAEATGTIMDSSEIIMEKAGEAGDAGAAITDEVMKIFEACSFQDITGQRITKVVTTLKDIEAKVSAIMEIVGGRLPGIDEGSSESESESAGGGASPSVDVSTVKDEDLLNGPQMDGNAISQDDIDKLLSQFD